MVDKKLKILFVEDELLTAIPVIQNMESEGYDVIHALTGKDAINIVNSGESAIDLILMDISLGTGMDGTDTAIKIHDKFDIPIIFYSAHTEKEIINKTQNIASYGYVAKPANFTVLDTSIRMAIRLFKEKQKVKEQQKNLEKYNEALKESEERLRNLSNNIPSGFVYQVDAGMDGEGREFTYISEGIEKLHGINPEQVIKNPPLIYDQFHEENREKIAELERISQDTFSTFFAETSYTNPLGEKRWVLITSAPRRLANGHIVWDGLEIDITKQKQAEQALKDSEAKLETTLASIADAVISTDINGSIIRMNPMAEKLTGCSFSQVKGEKLENVYNTVSLGTDSESKPLYKEVIEKGSIIRKDNESKLISSDKKEYIITESCSPITDQKGNITGAVLVFRDITRTMEMQTQLQRSQKLEALGALAGGIAHDFNNLLMGIFGFIELAIARIQDPVTKEYLEESLKTMNRAKSLTSQLLTFSKGGTPMKSLESINEFLKDIIQFPLSGSNISPQYDIPEDLWLCNIDKNQISQAIENIVINAQQAMPLGGRIFISAENIYIDEDSSLSIPRGEFIKLSIKDEGTGIPQKIRPHLFDPFFTTKSKGHGLGLAISYSIIKKHGGIIEVNTVLEKGSTFNIYIPAEKDKTLKASRGGSISHQGRGKILIMDDEEVILKSLSMILESIGYTVIAKENGAQVIDYLLSENNPAGDLRAMIFDLTIPGGMGGKETIAKVRDLDITVPVFVSSGYSDNPIISNPDKYGFTASISKPFRVNELIQLLDEYL